MKAFEFSTRLQEPNSVAIPAEVASHLKVDQPVRVLLLISDSDEDKAWADLTSAQFLQGYDAGDAIYDQLQPR